MLLVVVAVVTQGLKIRPGGMEIGVGIGIVVAYVFVAARMGMAAERTHLFEYSVLALFLHEALLERRSNSRQVPAPALLAIGLAAGFGVVDETIQWIVPSRVFDPVDIGVDSLAAFLAVMTNAVLGWVRGIAGRFANTR